MISSSGESGETRGGKCGHFLSPQCVSDFVPGRVCLRARCTGTPASCDVRLTAIIRVYHRSAPHSFPFVPSVCAPPGLVSTQCGLQQRPVVVCSRLIKLVSVTGKLHLKHMAMSVPFTQHSMFSRSTEQTANEPRSDERKTTATEHLEDNITNEACMFVFFPYCLCVHIFMHDDG